MCRCRRASVSDQSASVHLSQLNRVPRAYINLMSPDRVRRSLANVIRINGDSRGGISYGIFMVTSIKYVWSFKESSAV